VSVATTAVPFVDFGPHVSALRPEIDAAIARVLDSGWFILGPEVDAFERELAAQLGTRDAVSVANGTDALQLALEARGVGPGHEVITSSLSAAFSGLAIRRAGAVPVFVDVDARTLNLAPDAVAGALTPRTKALMPVHLYGHPADLDPLLELARAHELVVIEDACQAHGAKYKGRSVGAASGVAALSFYPTKNLGAFGDGGAVLVEDPGVAARLRQLRNGGQTERYHHEIVGTNSRLDELHAAILRAKLKHLPAWTERRRQLAALYSAELEGSGVELQVEQPWARAVQHLYVVRHDRRDALQAELKRRGVGTLVHFPIPLHLQPCFAVAGRPPVRLPVVERECRRLLSLPLYPELRDDQVRYVAGAVWASVAALG
jgi:dTDP-4-amino-4,6-dideoxygalactose transaminase